MKLLKALQEALLVVVSLVFFGFAVYLQTILVVICKDGDPGTNNSMAFTILTCVMIGVSLGAAQSCTTNLKHALQVTEISTVCAFAILAWFGTAQNVFTLNMMLAGSIAGMIIGKAGRERELATA